MGISVDVAVNVLEWVFVAVCVRVGTTVRVVVCDALCVRVDVFVYVQE